MIDKKIKGKEISAETMEHIMYKANTLVNCYRSFCEKNKINDSNFDVVDMYDALLSIVEDLGIYEDVIEKKIYYVLPCDSYGQPDGTVEEREMTKFEAMETPYCFEDYQEAVARAMD